jgi:hypothetical protein
MQCSRDAGTTFWRDLSLGLYSIVADKIAIHDGYCCLVFQSYE